MGMTGQEACREVRDALLAGCDIPSRLDPHVRRCPACEVLVSELGLGAALGRVEPAADEGLESLFGRIQEDVESELGPLARLRALPSLSRFALALGGLVALTGLTALLAIRSDWSVYPAPRMGLALGLYGVLAALSIRGALRPLSSLGGRSLDLVLVTLSILVIPLGLSLLPAAQVEHPASLFGGGDAWLSWATPCLTVGVLAALPIVILLWMLDRGGQLARGRIALAAAAGGMAGSLALHLECPITLGVHLLAGHAPVPLAVLVLATGLVLLRRSTRA